MSGAPQLDVDGPAAPPRLNGELVFEAPWQSRVFGVTMALCEAGTLDWAAFRDRLIANIAARPDEYWATWQDALEAELDARAGLDPGLVGGRAAELALRPHGHDH